MDICANHFKAAFGGMLLSSLAMAQTAYPDLVIQNVNWHSGVHHYAVTQKILSPGVPSEPVTITGTADAEFVSGTQVHLTKGFHAGDFHNDGHFHAYIDENLGAPGDVVVIAPEPATHITGNVLHVNKWEKLEIGVRLPQDLQDAIDRFFTDYYADTIDPYVSTPENVDPVHDLNPYADDSLQLVLTLTSPSGAQSLKWGFFMREAKWAGTDTTSLPEEDPDSPLHPYHVRFRFAPDEEGAWQFTLSLKAPNTSTLAGSPLAAVLCTGYALVCDPPLPDNHGPLEANANNQRTLRFEDGTSYFGLGLNLENAGFGHHIPGCGFPNETWADSNSYRLLRFNYDNLNQAMGNLSSVGGNFARIWMGSFGPEFTNLGVYDASRNLLQCGSDSIVHCTPVVRGNGQYNAWVFDQLLDSARQHGIYVQLCIVPYPPIVAYEPWAWKHDPYLLHFVEPRDPATGLYDMKRYFYSNGDPATAAQAGSAFYYWKRKYKYILSRWGWSVNIPIIEPFNEIDQMLTYSTVDMTDPDYDNNCAENNLLWPADSALPGTISQWVSDIAQFVRSDVDLNDPASSSLGYGKKLFLMSYARSEPNLNGGDQYYAPFFNPDVDLTDAHRGMYSGEGELSNSFNESEHFREQYTSTVGGITYEKPFHQGESNYYEIKDVYGINQPNDTVSVDAAQYFDNYDVSFHNEIWASTFFGNFAAATTWQKERVFWWEHELKVPPKDGPHGSFPGNQYQYLFSNNLGDTNMLDLGSAYPVVNKPIYHNFKPLTDFLSNPNLQPFDFFNGDIAPHKAYDNVSKLECYYLTNEDSTMAIGWVHNLNAYWEKHYYLQQAVQNYLGCTPPAAQSITLPGFQPDLDYHITWYSTRMNDTIHPVDGLDTTGTGTVLLDMSSVPLGGVVYNYLDTLHADYAFIVALQPVHRNMQVAADPPPVDSIEDFGMFPNPASNSVTLVLPSDGLLREVTLYDLTGRRVFSRTGVAAPVLEVPTGELDRGAYAVRVSDPMSSQTKTLILRWP